jgi:hypothetical protein
MSRRAATLTALFFLFAASSQIDIRPLLQYPRALLDRQPDLWPVFDRALE